MKLSDILRKVTVAASKGDLQREITGVNIDSRQVKAGDLFVAVKGTQADGHQYISKAIELGAVAILMSEPIPAEAQENVTYVQVDDTEDAVGKVATTFYGDPTTKLKLVGVTGTMVKLRLPQCSITCSALSDISVVCALPYATLLMVVRFQPIIQLPTP